jgi:CRP-like cAMP-binding protein
MSDPYHGGVDEILTNTVLFAGLRPDAALTLEKVAQWRRLERGEVVFRLGDLGTSMYVIIRGKIGMTRPAGADRDSLLSVLGPGDLLGEFTLFDPAPRKATATALTDLELAEFTASAVRHWLQEEPDAAWHFLQLLARVLLDLAAKFGTPTSEGVRVDHGLTQEQLAHYVGASRESVYKSLSELASRGVVRLEPRCLVILDIAKLTHKANA